MNPQPEEQRLVGENEMEETEVETVREAKFSIGDVVCHRFHPFRGVIYDVDPTFSNSEEWYESIPIEVRPARDQPYYHLLAENDESSYIAYVSEQNLLVDESGKPVSHPQVEEFFAGQADGRYIMHETYAN